MFYTSDIYACLYEKDKDLGVQWRKKYVKRLKQRRGKWVNSGPNNNHPLVPLFNTPQNA